MAKEEKKLLVVDDEAIFLKILTKIFSNHFTVRTAENGLEALEILKSGFKPGVILSDQRMPIMNGSEFLAKSMSIAPDAVRIIITGYSLPKDIIPCINEAHAYMYIKKPSDEAELVQSVKVAYDHYLSKVKNRELLNRLKSSNDTLKKSNEKLKELVVENRKSTTQIIQGLSEFAEKNEKYYFTKHTQSVTLIANSLANHIGFASDKINRTVLAALLCYTPYVGMPDEFLLKDPIDLDNSRLDEFFEYYLNAIESLRKVELIVPFLDYILQVWERSDGAGWPRRLSGKDIDSIAHIIKIAKVYHNLVYRLRFDDLQMLRNKGKIVQTPDITKKRHEEAIKQISRKAGNFDVEVLRNFIDLVKKKDVAYLQPSNSIHKIIFQDGISTTSKEEISYEESFENNKPIPKGKRTEISMSIEDLLPGAVSSKDIITKNGMTIARKDMVLTSAMVKNIKQLEEVGLLPENIAIYEEK